jgi:hypothetical protein
MFVLGIPRCASKMLKFLTSCILVPAFNIEATFGRSPFDGFLPYTSAWPLCFHQYVGYTGTGSASSALCLAGRLPPPVLQPAVWSQIWVNMLHFYRGSAFDIFYTTTCNECSVLSHISEIII